MVINRVLFSKNFLKRSQKLPTEIIQLANKKIELFKANPLHPSLRLHELHGHLKELWSITITENYRVVFERQENGDIFFVSIGKHDIYKHL